MWTRAHLLLFNISVFTKAIVNYRPQFGKTPIYLSYLSELKIVSAILGISIISYISYSISHEKFAFCSLIQVRTLFI
jgi:hypothetical protein